jgi:nucleoside-diphosphate-sugar epimerase
MLTHNTVEPGRPRRVVILGGRGFVGKRLTEHLAVEDISVRAIGRDSIDLAADDAEGKLLAELRPEDTVVVLAALTPDKGRGVPAFLANLRVGAAVHAALERRRVAHVVYVSSDAVYPFRAALIDESSCAEPTDLYGAMHLAREIMLKQGAEVPVGILRPTLIYGAGDTHNSYGPNRLRRMARKDGRIVLFGAGEETRDHIYIDDVVALIAQVIRHRSTGILNLASGHSISFAALAEMVARQFPTPVEIAGAPRQSSITHRAFNVTAIHKAFPEFVFTPLDKGLAQSHRDETA